ncbi:NAD(P)-dependent oxidoreductase [Polaromonas sp. AER18D-145]|uniref:NAD-dependent epimerase/dehydratase family protein n=1 Tax=Polaromonas sp. AER18D-145 TaxID=1977060 RepID=UPI000BBC887B|nr:NAD(P)-dependent oxidoreductase [Polaromonas sp. AER18D-145]
MGALDPAVLLTGRTSTIGPLVTPLLLAQGMPVHALGRKPPTEGDRRPGLHWLPLDLADPLRAMPGVSAATLIHTASLWLLPGWLEKFHARGVRRVIAFSSTSRFTKQASASPYELEVVNKLIAAEDHVAAECERLGIAWTIFRPTLIYGGAGSDRNVADIARLIRKFGVFPVFGSASGRRQPVNAADLAQACLQSLTAPASYNKAYNLSGGETLAYVDMVRRIFETLGRQPRFIRIPLSAFKLAVKLARLHPRFAHLTPDMALRMQADLVFDHSDATRDFGYSPGRFDPSYLTALP